MSLEVHRVSLGFPAIEQRAWPIRFGARPNHLCQRRRVRPAELAAEFRRFLMMATGSADEMQVWSLYARDLGYIDADMAERWQGEYREIARMLQGLARAASQSDI